MPAGRLRRCDEAIFTDSAADTGQPVGRVHALTRAGRAAANSWCQLTQCCLPPLTLLVSITVDISPAVIAYTQCWSAQFSAAQLQLNVAQHS